MNQFIHNYLVKENIKQQQNKTKKQKKEIKTVVKLILDLINSNPQSVTDKSFTLLAKTISVIIALDLSFQKFFTKHNGVKIIMNVSKANFLHIQAVIDGIFNNFNKSLSRKYYEQLAFKYFKDQADKNRQDVYEVKV